MISEELKNDLKIKWDRMRDGMAKMGMDACLLTVDVNLYYTTGQIYSGYFYLPVDGEPWFLIKRPNGLSGHQVEYIRKPEDIPTLFAERGIKIYIYGKQTGIHTHLCHTISHPIPFYL